MVFFLLSRGAGTSSVWKGALPRLSYNCGGAYPGSPDFATLDLQLTMEQESIKVTGRLSNK